MRARQILESLLFLEAGEGLRLRRHGFRPLTDADRRYLPAGVAAGDVVIKVTDDGAIVYDFTRRYVVEYDRNGRSLDARHISIDDFVNELDREARQARVGAVR
jgi:hypothetical protein